MIRMEEGGVGEVPGAGAGERLVTVRSQFPKLVVICHVANAYSRRPRRFFKSPVLILMEHRIRDRLRRRRL